VCRVGDGDIKALWALAEHAVATDGDSGILRATVCLEAVIQAASNTRIMPRTELETRLRLGDLLSRGAATLSRARSHLERAVRLCAAAAHIVACRYSCFTCGCAVRRSWCLRKRSQLA
jgi:hypothetical protein